MENIKKYATGILGGILLLAAFYFFEYKPSIKNARIEGYRAGLIEYESNTDTLIIHGKDSIVYRDRFITIEKPVKDSIGLLTSSFDSTLVSGKDTISTKTIVSINPSTSRANWNFEIKHKDYAQLPDTIKIYTPKYIDKVIIENNWLYNLIAYVGGLVTAAILFLL